MKASRLLKGSADGQADTQAWGPSGALQDKARLAYLSEMVNERNEDAGAENAPSLRLGELAYRAVLEALYDRRIPAGGVSSQHELAELLNLPIQPLRDALRVLETEGVLKIHPRAGIEFLKADLELARSTYQFRSIIERAGVRALAEHGDKSMVETLLAEHQAFSDFVNERGLTPETLETLQSLENRLHGLIVGSLKNSLIETTARRINTYVALIRMDRRMTPPVVQRTLAEHIEVLKACARHDANAAEEALISHFQGALQRIMGMA